MRSLLALLTVLALAGEAHGEPPAPPVPLSESLHILVPFHVTTQGGAELDLAPGRYIPEATWSKLDLEIRRLQDAETRLKAENASFRASAAADTGPGWGTVTWIGLALTAGIVFGAYAL